MHAHKNNSPSKLEKASKATLYATMTSNSVYGRFLANIGLQDKRACWEKVFETHTIFLSDYYVSVVTSVNI